MPWTSTAPIDRERSYLITATRSTLASRRHLPAIFRESHNMWSGLAATDGLVGYSMRSVVAKGTIATLSVWQSPASLTAFVRGQQHTAGG